MPYKKIMLATAIAVSMIAGAGTAATLTGDEVVITFQPIKVVFGPFTVGAGIERTVGIITFDLNAGVGANEFEFIDNGGSFAGSSSLVLSSLDFSGGAILTGFNLTSTSLTGLSWTFTDTSLTFSFDDAVGPNNGSAIRGQFATLSAVPLPASLPMLAAALGGFAFLLRRARKAPRKMA
jgi:hypothetical protein